MCPQHRRNTPAPGVPAQAVWCARGLRRAQGKLDKGAEEKSPGTKGMKCLAVTLASGGGRGWYCEDHLRT